MSTTTAKCLAAKKRLDPSDAYDLCNHEHLRLVSSSSSSSRSASAASSTADLLAFVEAKESTGNEVDTAQTSDNGWPQSGEEDNTDNDDLNSANAEHLIEPVVASSIELYRSPRTKKASLVRKLMAFTTDADEIAEVCITNHIQMPFYIPIIT